jgi:hypothetical protein
MRAGAAFFAPGRCEVCGGRAARAGRGVAAGAPTTAGETDEDASGVAPAAASDTPPAGTARAVGAGPLDVSAGVSSCGAPPLSGAG